MFCYKGPTIKTFNHKKLELQAKNETLSYFELSESDKANSFSREEKLSKLDWKLDCFDPDWIVLLRYTETNL